MSYTVTISRKKLYFVVLFSFGIRLVRATGNKRVFLRFEIGVEL